MPCTPGSSPDALPSPSKRPPRVLGPALRLSTPIANTARLKMDHSVPPDLLVWASVIEIPVSIDNTM